MKVDAAWCAKEHTAIQTLESEAKERRERLRNAAFKLANKLDRTSAGEEVTKSFEARYSGRTLRFSKIASVSVKIPKDAADKVFGSTARKYQKRSFDVDKAELEAVWDKLPAAARKQLLKAIKPSMDYDPDAIDRAYKQGEITEKELLTVTEKTVSHSFRVTPLKK